MDKRSMAVTVLILRVLTLLFLIGSIAILTLDYVNVPLSDEITFTSFFAYRYVFAVDAIGCAYMLVQIILWSITLSRRTYFYSRLVTWFHQFFDLVFALLFATGAGAGFGLTLDMKRLFDGNGTNAVVPGFIKYFDLAYISSGLLLMATVTLAAAVLSSTYVLVRK